MHRICAHLLITFASLALYATVCSADDAAASMAPAERGKLAWRPLETPTGWIEGLQVAQRQLLDRDAPKEELAAAEARVAKKLAELIAREPGHWSLTERDAAGNTPLTLAVSGAHLHVVKALLTDSSVVLRINEPLPNGATPWVLASIAPRVSLPACQPAMLTVERTPLLRPYWKQMKALLADPDKPINGTLTALLEAGAAPDPERARTFWKLRCPSAWPATQAAVELADAILPAVVNQSVEAINGFTRQIASDRMAVVAEPPLGTVFRFPNFQFSAKAGPSLEPPPESVRTACPIKPAPQLLGAINWSGTLTLNAIVQVESGVITGLDLTAVPSTVDRNVKRYFSTLVIDAYSRYVCGGQLAFSQEFKFKIE